MKLLVAFAILYAIWWLNKRRRAPTLSSAEALALLDLPAGANAEQVTAAHRRLIARVHPDAGGSAALAGRVNAARDLLLAELDQRPLRAG